MEFILGIITGILLVIAVTFLILSLQNKAKNIIKDISSKVEGKAKIIEPGNPLDKFDEYFTNREENLF